MPYILEYRDYDPDMSYTEEYSLRSEVFLHLAKDVAQSFIDMDGFFEDQRDFSEQLISIIEEGIQKIDQGIDIEYDELLNIWSKYLEKTVNVCYFVKHVEETFSKSIPTTKDVRDLLHKVRQKWASWNGDK